MESLLSHLTAKMIGGLADNPVKPGTQNIISMLSVIKQDAEQHEIRFLSKTVQ